MDNVKVMGYILGSAEGWDGDMEGLQFTGFKPAEEITDWPTESDCIHIDYVNGQVTAYDNEGQPIRKWRWLDFIANINPN